MLLSQSELRVWTGLGPLELALHSFGLVVFTCLASLQAEGVISTSWHAIFSPLYVALVLHVYYLAVLSARLVMWGFQPPRSDKAVLTIMIASSFAGVAVLFYVEYATAGFLNGTERQANLVTSFVCLLVYLFVRLFFVHRTLKSIPSQL